MEKRKRNLFQEEYLDETELKKSEVDVKDPLVFDIEDPLETTFEMEATDGFDLDGFPIHEPSEDFENPVPEVSLKKSRFSFGKSKKKTNDIEDVVLTEEQIDSAVEEFYDDSLSIEELEQRERIRQRQELAQAEIEKKKEDRSDYFKSFKTVGTITAFILFTFVTSMYLWWLNGALLPSILLGAVGSMKLTYWFYHRKNVVDKEEEEFKSLRHIATQINFNMQNGKNVADTLLGIKDDFDGRVGADLNYMYSKLMVEGELVTDHFEKYNFTSFDIFMRNLQIAYYDGVDTKKLFKFPLSNINYESVERDNLSRKNQASKRQELMTVAIGIFIPASIRFFAKEVFMAYLGYQLIAVAFSAIIVFAFIKIACSLQRLSLDVSVSI